MKKLFFIFTILLLTRVAKAYAQPSFHITGTFSTPGFSPTSFPGQSNDAIDQLYRQMYARQGALLAEHARQIYRFDRKLGISITVVSTMNEAYSKASKYPRVKQLYQKSYKTYKELERLSKTAAENKQKDFTEYQQKQDEIIQKAVADYHKARDIEELGETRAKVVDEAAAGLNIDKNLSAADKATLKQEIEKIRFAESQIKKLDINANQANKEKVGAERKAAYQTIAQSIVFLSKITETAITAINPSKNASQATMLTQTVVEKYIEENVENGKSPADALSTAFAKGYDKLKQDELLKTVTPLKNLAKVPLMAKSLATEIEKWEKIEKNQRAVIYKIDEIVRFSEDGIKKNQLIIDRSTANSKIIINKAVMQYLQKPLPKQKVPAN